MTDHIKHGDYVKTSPHGHIGRVYGFSKLTNKDADWVAGLADPLTIEDIQGRMVSVLVHDSGAVCVPESRCSVTTVIKNFRHRDMADHFGNSMENIPAAACWECGGWTSSGGMSQYSMNDYSVDGRTGCNCHRVV